MEIFEHMTVAIRVGYEDVNKVLNEHGNMGWEPYAVIDKSLTTPGARIEVYLKRRRRAPPSQSGLTGYIES